MCRWFITFRSETVRMIKAPKGNLCAQKVRTVIVQKDMEIEIVFKLSWDDVYHSSQIQIVKANIAPRTTDARKQAKKSSSRFDLITSVTILSIEAPTELLNRSMEPVIVLTFWVWKWKRYRRRRKLNSSLSPPRHPHHLITSVIVCNEKLFDKWWK